MSRSSPTPGVYVVLVNWNGWADTVECLESVFRLRYPSYRVFVCDNASQDQSLERISAWAEGRLAVPTAEGSALRRLSSPPVRKPVTYALHQRAEAERGPRVADAVRLELVATGSNLGFAGGNNVALRCALARDDFEYAWLLNNDTVVEPDALDHLVGRMSESPKAGLCGSKLLEYEPPHAVQALGGATYNRWLGSARQIHSEHSGRAEAVESRMAYVVGASMLVSKAFLRDVGLMSEDYFLFFEELDWVARARGRYGLAYAPGSVVYHKAGRSTGFSRRHYNAAAEIRLHHSQIRYTRTHMPLFLPMLGLRHLLVLLNSLATLRLPRARAVARLYRELLGGAPAARR